MSATVNTVVQTSTVESETAALHRLAQQARDKGVQIIIDEDNRHWATSVSRPGERYVVSLLACSCPGFVRWGRCHHHALVLAEYFCLPALPAIDPDPDPGGGGVALVDPFAWTVAHEPDGERPPFAVRYAGVDVVDRPVRRFWREPAARTECELLNRAADRAAEVAASTVTSVAVEADVVVLVLSIVPSRPVVEGAYTAHAGTRPDGSTYRILHADALVIDGVPHRVGDRVLVTDRRWGWTEARITCIRTVGATGKIWKIDVDGTGYGETTRSLTEVRAIAAVSSEGVRHAA